MGIHPKRKIPKFPAQNFPSWAKRHKLTSKPRDGQKRKVAYFAGCSARYIFPELPKAVVSIFRRNNIEVYYPPQQCCGMPPMLEGDRQLALRMAARTVGHLAEVVDDGYDVVCSCPTCGYMIRQVLKQGAYYSKSYQEYVGGDATLLKIPVKEKPAPSSNNASPSLPTPLKAEFGSHHITRKQIALPEQGSSGAKSAEFMLLDKSLYGKIMKDDGYFSSIDPLQRIKVSENTHDLGEYLLKLHRSGELDTRLGNLSGRVLYYPPCHQREQEIGMPYLELLKLVPGIQTESLQSTFYCCGMAGIMGYKRDFHIGSLHIGSRLIGKIKEIDPDRLITDCLSCRLQFMQTTAYDVLHPIEILWEAYRVH
jgi:glycerol-3-phosphate dehydrogenase subunit C